MKQNLLLFFFASTLYPTPPTQMPQNLYNDYTLNGQIDVQYMYFNGTIPENSPVNFTKEIIFNYLEDIRQQKPFYYGATDLWLYKAIEKHQIKNQKVIIFGSFEPLYESICLFYGGIPTTIEYNKWTTNHPDLSCMTPEEYEKNPILFDCGFSISSFEHDGLGRYGDPIDPWADLKIMKKIKKMIKPNGLLFLAVPVGHDTLVWNAHRIYGNIRLPSLLESWEVIDLFGITGLNDPIFNQSPNRHFIQPIFVLKNTP